MWEISKSFNFCYGHRVYTQTTNEEFALNRPPKCRHNHGHEGLLHVFIEGTTQPDGMVTDFCNLGWFKKFLDDVVDHKFVFGKDDPWYADIAALCTVPVYLPETGTIAGHVVDLNNYLEGTPEYEIMEGYFKVNFIPTSENLSRWAWMMCDTKMQRIGVSVSKVEWWETPKSCATYYAPV